MANTEVKIFKVSGYYVKLHQRLTFNRYIRALKPEHAKEIVLSEITRVRVFRRKVHLDEIKEVSLEECPDLFIHSLMEHK